MLCCCIRIHPRIFVQLGRFARILGSCALHRLLSSKRRVTSGKAGPSDFVEGGETFSSVVPDLQHLRFERLDRVSSDSVRVEPSLGRLPLLSSSSFSWVFIGTFAKFSFFIKCTSKS